MNKQTPFYKEMEKLCIRFIDFDVEHNRCKTIIGILQIPVIGTSINILRRVIYKTPNMSLLTKIIKNPNITRYQSEIMLNQYDKILYVTEDNILKKDILQIIETKPKNKTSKDLQLYISDSELKDFIKEKIIFSFHGVTDMMVKCIALSTFYNTHTSLNSDPDIISCWADQIPFSGLISSYTTDRLSIFDKFTLIFTKYEKKYHTIVFKNVKIETALMEFFRLFLNDKYDGTERNPYTLVGSPYDSSTLAEGIILLTETYKNTIADMINNFPIYNLIIVCMLLHCKKNPENHYTLKNIYCNLVDLLQTAATVRKESSIIKKKYEAGMLKILPEIESSKLIHLLDFIPTYFASMEYKPISEVIAKYEEIVDEKFPDAWKLILVSSIID